MGSVGGYGIGLLVTPLISRVFSPESYGTFATLVAVVSVFVGLSTFRLEVLSQRVTDSEYARRLRVLGLSTAVAWGVGLTVVTAIWIMAGGVDLVWLAVGPLVALTSLQLLVAAALTRAGNYRALAVANFFQGAGIGVLQLCFGMISSAVWALLGGFAAARLVWVPGLFADKLNANTLLSTWRDARPFALNAGASAGINSLAGQIPILVGAWLYGGAQVGFLAMAVRLLLGPLNIVGQAAAAANLGEVGRLLRDRQPGASRLVGRAMRDLFVLGVVPCTLAALLGRTVVPWVLGPEWGDAGLMVALLALGGLCQFIVAPFSQVLNLTGHHGRLLAWDAARFILILLAFVIPAQLSMPFTVAVGAYSFALVCAYGALMLLCRRALATPVTLSIHTL